MGVLEKLLYFFVPDIEERLEQAIYKLEHGGSEEDIDTIVDDYFHLIRRTSHKIMKFKKPEKVEFTDHDMILMVDDIEYDFDAYIHHNDSRNSSRKYEIEILFSPDLPRETVRERLMERINRDWYINRYKR
ncbi:hypothetical protein GPL15_00180 [Clostridium sp. MCC353]|uniref:hypothetical protein n=1 Tax=Clostridium sp. MCC353 TaxID=2592646 RepID=UPI001C01DC8B|nr:hypothetical protein [Clostridium sp. MCC353]MBT9774925.1 hypothetical protein [Clostridium sp. MCC353]